MLVNISLTLFLKNLRFLSFALILTLANHILMAQVDCDLPWKNHINDIQFITTDIGFAAGEDGVIFKTSDGGENWVQLNTHSEISFNDIHFLDPQTGLAVGDGGALKTEDSGVSWTLIKSGINVNTGLIIDPSTIYLFADGSIQKTENGGDVWTTLLSDPDLEFSAIHFINASTGYAIQNDIDENNSAIIRTINGGANWIIIKPVFDEYLRDLKFTDQNVGYAIGHKDSFFKTIDGGMTWSKITTNLPGGSERLFFLTNDVGFIYNNQLVPYIWKTIDGGLTWSFISLPAGAVQNSVYFLSENSGRISGTTAEPDARTSLYTTSDGGTTWETNVVVPSIQGAATSYQGLYEDYSVAEFPDCTYQWQVEGGTIVAQQNKAKVLWTESAGSISVKITKTVNQCTHDLSLDVLSDTQAPLSLCNFRLKETMNDITFPTSEIGYLAGNLGILKTIDGGETWEPLNVPPNVNFQDIVFLDEQFGLAGAPGILIKTEDGGKTWNTIASFGRCERSSIHIENKSTFYVADGQLRKTTDGGATWNIIVPYIEGVGRLLSIQFTDQNHAYARWVNEIGSEDSGIVKTMDNWSTWTYVTVDGEQYPNSRLGYVYFTDNETGYGIGNPGLYKSIDGGLTWDELSIAHQGTKSSFFFLNNSVALMRSPGLIEWLGGGSPDMPKGMEGISKTIDGAVSWQSNFPLPYTHKLLIYLTDENNGILFAGNFEESPPFYSTGTNIYKTSDGGTTWLPSSLDPPVSATSTPCIGGVQEFIASELFNGTYQWEAVGGDIAGPSDKNRASVIWNSGASGVLNLSISNGVCLIHRSFNVIVDPNHIAPDVDVIASGITATATGTSLTYQWYVDDLAIPEELGGKSQSIVAQKSGDYFVVGTDANGCAGRSESIRIELPENPGPGPVTAAEGDSNAGISIYPVPLSDRSVLKIENEYQGEVILTVRNIVGQVVGQGRYIKYSDNLEELLPASTTPGLYSVHVVMGRSEHIIRVIRN